MGAAAQGGPGGASGGYSHTVLQTSTAHVCQALTFAFFCLSARVSLLQTPPCLALRCRQQRQGGCLSVPPQRPTTSSLETQRRLLPPLLPLKTP